MSSTNRTKDEKAADPDYYATDLQAIRDFVSASRSDAGTISTGLDDPNAKVLDPCAGGSEGAICNIPMSYPQVLGEFGFSSIDTIDIRQDSLAAVKADYLKTDCRGKYDLIISNPPFQLALQIIEKALDDVRSENGKIGHVIMLQRLNFLGSQARKPFFQKNMPEAVFVHSKRIKFTQPSGKSGTDSIEYAHYVWSKNGKARKSSFLMLV